MNLSHHEQKCQDRDGSADGGSGEDHICDSVQVVTAVCCIGIFAGRAVADDLLLTVGICSFHIVFPPWLFVMLQGYNMLSTIKRTIKFAAEFHPLHPSCICGIIKTASPIGGSK